MHIHKTNEAVFKKPLRALKKPVLFANCSNLMMVTFILIFGMRSIYLDLNETRKF